MPRKIKLCLKLFVLDYIITIDILVLLIQYLQPYSDSCACHLLLIIVYSFNVTTTFILTKPHGACRLCEAEYYALVAE